jgi:multiple sugar transport system substrate-binding protein
MATGDGRIFLRYLTFEAQAQQVKILKEIIRRFEEKHPHIHVQLEANLNAGNKIMVEIASGVPPDVFYMDTNNLVKMAKNKAIVNLRPYAERDGVDLGRYFPASIEALTYEGGLYAMPSDLSTRVLFYNTRLFDKYGVKRPDGTWTVQEYLDAAKRLTRDDNGDGRTDIYGTIAIIQDYLLWAMQNGAEVFNSDFTRCTVDGPEAREALHLLIDMKDREHVVPSRADMANTSPLQMFQSERVAMIIGRTFMATELNKTMAGRYDAAPLPRWKGAINLLTVGGNAVAAQGKHIEEAWQFVRFYSSPEVQMLRGSVKNCVPAIIGAAESKKGFNCPPPDHVSVFIDEVRRSRPETPRILRANEFKQEICVPTFENLTLGRISVEDALKQIQEKTNELLERD